MNRFFRKRFFYGFIFDQGIQTLSIMKTDRFTKTVLSIIAICLVIIVFRDTQIIPEAQATSNSTMNNIPNYAFIPVNEDGSINVKLTPYQTIDVNLKNIDTYDELRVDLRNINTNDELDVNIDEIGGGWISNGGPISVRITQ